jgi:hypothetical protein
LGIFYNNARVPELNTITSFIEADNKIVAVKKLLSNSEAFSKGKLNFHSCHDPWIDTYSLETIIFNAVARHDLSLDEIFSASKKWLIEIIKCAIKKNGVYFVEGNFLDCIWKNTFIIKNKCIFIDQEWEWSERIPLKIIVIRALYLFFMDIRKRNSYLSPTLKNKSTYKLIKEISNKCYNIEIEIKDYIEFYKLESNFQHIVTGKGFSFLEFLFKSFSWPQRNGIFLTLKIKNFFIRICRVLQLKLWYKIES